MSRLLGVPPALPPLPVLQQEKEAERAERHAAAAAHKAAGSDAADCKAQGFTATELQSKLEAMLSSVEDERLRPMRKQGFLAMAKCCDLSDPSTSGVLANSRRHHRRDARVGPRIRRARALE